MLDLSEHSYLCSSQARYAVAVQTDHQNVQMDSSWEQKVQSPQRYGAKGSHTSAGPQGVWVAAKNRKEGLKNAGEVVWYEDQNSQ